MTDILQMKFLNELLSNIFFAKITSLLLWVQSIIRWLVLGNSLVPNMRQIIICTNDDLVQYSHDDVIKMETFSALLAICAGNSPVPGDFPTQRPVTRSFDGFFYLRPNKRLNKQTWGWWFETPSRPLWRYCNASKPHTASVQLNRVFLYAKGLQSCFSDTRIIVILRQSQWNKPGRYS